MSDWPVPTEELVNSLSPTGAKAETFQRKFASIATGALTSGTLHLVAIHLPAGVPITSITFLAGSTALVTGTHQWFALLDQDRNFLAKTANDTSAAWAASTTKTLALTAPYMTLYDGLYYIGIVVVATTVPTYAGFSGTSAANGLTPRLNGTSTTGLTDPASGTSPTTVISNLWVTPYVYLS